MKYMMYELIKECRKLYYIFHDTVKSILGHCCVFCFFFDLWLLQNWRTPLILLPQPGWLHIFGTWFFLHFSSLFTGIMLHPGQEHDFLVFITIFECFIFCHVIDRRRCMSFLNKELIHQFPEWCCHYTSSISTGSLFWKCSVRLW